MQNAERKIPLSLTLSPAGRGEGEGAEENGEGAGVMQEKTFAIVRDLFGTTKR